MRYRKILRALTLSASFASCALLTACGAERTASAQTTAAQEPEPVSLVIQMTGLLLLVPDSSSGRTHVLMPPMSDHIAWIGFRGADLNCTGYDPQRGICYIDMDSSSLSIGVQDQGVAGVGHALPRGALNLTRGSKSRKIDLQDARTRIRSEITLDAGGVTDSCSVAQWTFNPVGADPPRRIPLINVLEWQIPDLGTDSLVLVRKRHSSGQTVSDTFIARKNQDEEIELLIMHVPGRGNNFGMVRRVARPASPHRAQESEIQATHQHFRAFYDVINDPRANRPLPRRPVRTQDKCHLTILGLEDLPTTESRSLGTLSCVMASGEAGP